MHENSYSHIKLEMQSSVNIPVIPSCTFWSSWRQVSVPVCWRFFLYFIFLFSFQIGSCTNQMGQIAIVSFQSSSPKVIECFNVESRILCMVYIPEEEKLKEQNKAPDSENVLAKTSNVPTICLGMEEGRWFLVLVLCV